MASVPRACCATNCFWVEGADGVVVAEEGTFDRTEEVCPQGAVGQVRVVQPAPVRRRTRRKSSGLPQVWIPHAHADRRAHGPGARRRYLRRGGCLARIQ